MEEEKIVFPLLRFNPPPRIVRPAVWPFHTIAAPLLFHYESKYSSQHFALNRTSSFIFNLGWRKTSQSLIVETILHLIHIY
jgi:hypothetical protein